MIRRLLLLNGLAILAVVLNHAGGWGQVAMFLWPDRYRPVIVPNWDQLGTLPYYVLLVIKQFAQFCIPAFVFISGFFVAYAVRGSQLVSIWKVVRTRITHLLVPYLIWSGVVFIGDAFQGITYKPVEYLQRLMTVGAEPGYYFIPLLCYLYLLSPLMVPVAMARCWLLLSISALIQLGRMILYYLDLFGVEIAELGPVRLMAAAWMPTGWLFFFALGIVASLRTQQFRQWLASRKRSLFAAVVVLFLLYLFESDLTLRATLSPWWGAGFGAVSYNLYALAFILCFLAFDQVSIPYSKALEQLGRRSYGIYLLHMKLMELVARAIRQIAPWLLSYQVLLFVPLVFVCGLTIPLVFMTFVARSRARRAYPYLFG